MVGSARVDGALSGFGALRRLDVVPRLVAVLDRARLDVPPEDFRPEDLRPEASAVAGTVLPRLGVLAARLFDA